MRIAVAGHPPPVIARPGRPAELVDVAISRPLGVVGTSSRGSVTVDVEAGSVVAFYTDGLIERRGESLDVGLERLRTAVKPDAADDVARSVMHQLIGSTANRDDVALVVLRRK